MAIIGEASRLSGVHVETIRYYERRGIVSPSGRTASGRRVYDAGAVARLRFVRRCRDLGFPLDEIGALLALSEARPEPCAEVRAIGERRLAQTRRRIRDLEALEASLAALVEDCVGGRADCPALDRLFSG